MKRHHFPHLYRLASRVLCVPASAAAVERIFSKNRPLMHICTIWKLNSTIPTTQLFPLSSVLSTDSILHYECYTHAYTHTRTHTRSTSVGCFVRTPIFDLLSYIDSMNSFYVVYNLYTLFSVLCTHTPQRTTGGWLNRCNDWIAGFVAVHDKYVGRYRIWKLAFL